MRENLAELDRAASEGAAGCPASGGAKVRAAWAAPPERRGRGTCGAAVEPCGPTPPPLRLFANTHSRERRGPGHSRTRRNDEATTSRVGRESSAPSIPANQSPPSNCPRRSSHGAPPGQSRSPGSAVPSGPSSSLSAGMASRVRAGLPHARTPRARVPLHP
ncbi:uncharacterized protein LOC104669526 [Rhinopithecus roxellana]|uniref:uncharacterized protein LOC104669526 n=1 Tax=Rhinopithecus roxellana TaxID=61622 RepID=UPI0005336AB6|nr:uncharacterized protein LOC104669526 [Rhinopithecus roxellana]